MLPVKFQSYFQQSSKCIMASIVIIPGRNTNYSCYQNAVQIFAFFCAFMTLSIKSFGSSYVFLNSILLFHEVFAQCSVRSSGKFRWQPNSSCPDDFFVIILETVCLRSFRSRTALANLGPRMNVNLTKNKTTVHSKT